MTAPQVEAPSSCVGVFGAGNMGSALGSVLREGGARVITTLAGRSARTARLVEAAGLEVVHDLEAFVGTASHILVVTPPGAAIDAATVLIDAARRTGAEPLIADMNAISPQTAEAVAAVVSPLGFVDGSISGPPPTDHPGARLYFSGPRAAEFVALPWCRVTPVDLGQRVGAASALKMSTASVYKGLVGLYAQAMRSADHYDVLDPVLADLRAAGYDLVGSVALAATKAHRYVPEMREIAQTQGGAGLPPELFAAFADVYAEISRRPLADDDPETVDRAMSAADVVARLKP
jgi:3-hydroxyisobutyrate dehydrogenase-like beta-hydroxyacid dehydrogenase